MSEPIQKPGRSKQDYGTPHVFIDACASRFGEIVWDLAASLENKKAPNCFTKDEDTFTKHWAWWSVADPQRTGAGVRARLPRHTVATKGAAK